MTVSCIVSKKLDASYCSGLSKSCLKTKKPEGTGGHVTKLDIERRIDLSYGAAKALGMLNDGRQKVRVSAPMPMPRPEIETKLAQD